MPADECLLDADRHARQEALDVRRSFIVQAPAGSGKTELLIQRYLRLLGTVDHPEEILAITFTRKAAAEMQLRVLEALRRSRAGEEPEQAHQLQTAALAAAALRRSAERDWNLIGSPGRMRILTLDAMNAAIAANQPVSAALSAGNAQIVVDADLRSIHRRAATATLDWLTDDGAARHAVQDVLSHLDNNTGLFVSYVARMLATRDQWLPFVGSGLLSGAESSELRVQLELGLEYAVVRHLSRTRAMLDNDQFRDLPVLADFAAASLQAENRGGAMPSLAGIDELPPADCESLMQWQGIAELMLLKNKAEFRRTVTKSVGFPTSDRPMKAAMTELLAGAAGNHRLAKLLDGVRTLPPVRYTDTQWSVLLALFRLLPLAVSELKRLFAEEDVADHTEVALNAAAALGSVDDPGDVALLLDYQIRHILVDEMQDTSSAQYNMLESLTGGWERGDGRTLFCVGDPMQSIYRFRNAQVGQFLLAADAGIGHVRFSPLLLRRNFRSVPRLVEWINRVFPDVLAETDDPASGAVTYAEAIAASINARDGDVRVHPVMGSDPAAEAAAGCDVIARLRAHGPDDSIAVLVRSRTQLPLLLSELRRHGIDYAAIEIDRLTDLPEIIDVLALARAGAHAGDRAAWLGVLRAPWVGLSWHDLHALVRDDMSQPVPDLLHDAERIASLSAEGQAALARVLPILKDLCAPRRLSSFRDRVEKCWLALGGPGALTDEWAIENVYRFFDVIERHSVGGNAPAVGDIEALLDDERVSNASARGVQVMTMHRAKGLQFDHVVLYGLGRVPGRGRSPVLSWSEVSSADGHKHRLIGPVGPQAETDRDPVHHYIAKLEKEKEEHEKGRLLYVACTRACTSLHLIGHVAVRPGGEGYSEPRSDSLLSPLWPHVAEAFAAAFDRSPPEPESGREDWLCPARRTFGAPWELPPPDELPGGLINRVDPVDGHEPQVEFYWVGTDARIAGTLVHRWLHCMAGRPSTQHVDDAAGRRQVTSRWLRELTVAGESIDTICDRVELALDNVLADEAGRWVLGGDGHAELALTGLYQGSLRSVVIDRVRIDDDGDHWIIDYKTSSHEGGDLEVFLSAEVKRYSDQLSTYAAIYEAWSGVTPRRALYFPLLRRLVEVRA